MVASVAAGVASATGAAVVSSATGAAVGAAVTGAAVTGASVAGVGAFVAGATATPPPPLTLTSIPSHHVFGFYLKEFCRAFVFRHLSVFRGGNNVTIGAVTRRMIVS